MTNSRRQLRPRVFRPSRNSLCLCGSGRKFKRCCAQTYSGRKPGERSRAALKRQDYEDALRECRADITQYTVWHKSHTEPAVRAGFSRIGLLLDTDIKALAYLVDLLFSSYIKIGRADELPAVLERLRVNIDDQRWQRKITYFQALHALWPGWNRDAGRKELKKLGSIEEEKDVQILQLYLDLFGDDLSFSKTEHLINSILDLTDSTTDRLHYRGTRAVQYLNIGDQIKAEEELAESISDFRAARSTEHLTSYACYRLALSLELLGAIRRDEKILNEAVGLYKKLLEDDDWTSAGRADLCRQLGDAYRHMAAWNFARDMYLRAQSIEPSAICTVFLSECALRLQKMEDAVSMIIGLDPQELDQHEYVDYVFVLAAISIEAGNHEILEKVRELLRGLDVSGPYFQERRDSLLLSVIETQKSGISETIIHRTRRLLAGLAKSASSYLILQPNFMGIGVNVGKVLEDLAKGQAQHASRALDNGVDPESSPTSRRSR